MPVYKSLKTIYYNLAPAGSKRHQWTYKFIQKVLINFRPLNVHYRQWVRRFDALTEQEIGEVQRSIQSMDNRPQFSVIMPVFNPDLPFLDEAIQSVRDQYYPHWELCISDDASTIPGVRELILKYASEDSRIRSVFRERNGHISASSNSALALATGDFVVLLDHDDRLHPMALYEAAQVIMKYPDSEIIYSDEDKITPRGKRHNPYFKPEFDYELLLSHNMVSHLGIYRLETVHKVGGFRLGLEGSQDYDLVLRIIEHINPDQIHHIPKVLYHWRATSQSAAENIHVKPYAIDAGERAINEHLARRGIKGHVTYKPEYTAYEIEYALPEPRPLVELILMGEPDEINSKGVQELLNNTRYEPLKITLGLLGQIEDPVLAGLNDDPRVSIQIMDGVKAPLLALNELVSASDADFIGILDRDLGGFSAGWLEKLMGQAIQDGIGAVGPKLLDKSGGVYSNGIILGAGELASHLFRGKDKDYLGYFGWGQLQRGYSAISGKCAVFERGKFLAIAGIDTQYQTEDYAWIDFCLRLRQHGLRNIICPSVRLSVQMEQVERPKPELIQADKSKLLNKWRDIIINDPAFNPNLEIRNGKIGINNRQDQLDSLWDQYFE